MTVLIKYKYNPKLFKSKSQIPIFPGRYYTFYRIVVFSGKSTLFHYRTFCLLKKNEQMQIWCAFCELKFNKIPIVQRLLSVSTYSAGINDNIREVAFYLFFIMYYRHFFSVGYFFLLLQFFCR
jgi:hypothetical protein